jgi:hypothetical protein
VRNLLLYHTEDHTIARRKELYAAEGQPHFSGRLWIPDDLESIDLRVGHAPIRARRANVTKAHANSRMSSSMARRTTSKAIV